MDEKKKSFRDKIDFGYSFRDIYIYIDVCVNKRFYWLLQLQNCLNNLQI